MKHTVLDGVFPLNFEGEMLSHSSSREPHKPRWVEFTLYRTHTGSYIISRVGMSLLFHGPGCKTVTRNRLTSVPALELNPDAVPCSECIAVFPSDTGEVVFPETSRCFAQKTTTAKGVIAAVARYDDNNSEYLTNVVKRLLIDAAKTDPDLEDALFDRMVD